MKNQFLAFTLLTSLQLAASQTELNFSNPHKCTVSIKDYLSDKQLYQSDKATFTFLISNMNFNKTLYIDIAKGEAEKRCHLICDSTVMNVTVEPTQIAYNQSEKNNKMKSLITFTQDLFTRPNFAKYGYDSLDKMGNTASYQYCMDNPDSEMALSYLCADHLCERHTPAEIKVVLEKMSPAFRETYSTNHYFRIASGTYEKMGVGDKLELHDFSLIGEKSSALEQTKGNSLFVFFSTGCGFTQEAIKIARQHKKRYEQIYLVFLDVEKPMKRALIKSKNVVQLWSEHERYDLQLIRLKICSVPTMIVVDANKNIEYMGSRGGYLKKYDPALLEKL